MENLVNGYVRIKKRYMEALDGTKNPIPLYTSPQTCVVVKLQNEVY